MWYKIYGCFTIYFLGVLMDMTLAPHQSDFVAWCLHVVHCVRCPRVSLGHNHYHREHCKDGGGQGSSSASSFGRFSNTSGRYKIYGCFTIYFLGVLMDMTLAPHQSDFVAWCLHVVHCVRCPRVSLGHNHYHREHCKDGGGQGSSSASSFGRFSNTSGQHP